MGKVKFATARRIFKDQLLNGEDVKKHGYAFRVGAGKLIKVIDFLKGNLLVKPGVMRDVGIAGYKFNNLSVYQRGGLAIADLFKSFKECTLSEDTVGFTTFSEITKLLTKRGEAKAGLSTYYIQFRHCGSTFEAMMKAFTSMEFQIEYKAKVKEEARELIDEWHSIELFVMWEYSNKHINLKSPDKSHCCTYALGGNFDGYVYDKYSCDKCINCLTFFKEKVLRFISRNEIFILTDDQTVTQEVRTMKESIPLLSKAIRMYMAHRMRALVQFAEIERIKISLKTNPQKLLIITDHKQKILQMEYCEGQVEYYGKKGKSCLGTMVVQWVKKNDHWGYSYQFIDIVFKGYDGQDNVQEAVSVEMLVKHIHSKFPGTKEIVFQSDNATCFASQELIPFIYHLHAKSKQKCHPIITDWIFTEAQTGRGRLDTHFSFVNIVLKSFVEDGNNIDLEEDIFKALCFKGGIAGATVILFDCSAIPKKCISPTFKSRVIGSRSTHHIIFHEDNVHIIESSGLTSPEIIKKEKLNKHKPSVLDGTVVQTFVSCKTPLFVPEPSRLDTASEVTVPQTTKVEAYMNALESSGIIQLPASETMEYPTSCQVCPVEPGWAKYPGNSTNKIPQDCMAKLVELYNIGKANKKHKVSADRAKEILNTTLIHARWDDQLTITVPKIKAFFSMAPSKIMVRAIGLAEVEQVDVDQAAAEQVNEQNNQEQTELNERETDGTVTPDLDKDNDNHI